MDGFESQDDETDAKKKKNSYLPLSSILSPCPRQFNLEEIECRYALASACPGQVNRIDLYAKIDMYSCCSGNMIE